MKNLITIIPCTIILFALILQFVAGQVMFIRLTETEQAVDVFRESLRQEGRISLESERRLRRTLAEKNSCPEREIEISGTRDPVPRGGLVEYRITFPVRGVIAAADFWHIGEKENQFYYLADRCAVSDYQPEADPETEEEADPETEEKADSDAEEAPPEDQKK